MKATNTIEECRQEHTKLIGKKSSHGGWIPFIVYFPYTDKIGHYGINFLPPETEIGSKYKQIYVPYYENTVIERL